MAPTSHTQTLGESNVFRTIQRIDVVAVSALGVVAAAVAIYDGKVANFIIGLFILGGVGLIVKAAVTAISDALVGSIEDAYDAGKDDTERRADVLDLALRRRN